MYLLVNRFLKRILVVVLPTLVGCSATVPKEVVELSYTLGQDLNAVHSSYRALIQTHFDGLRAQTISFLEDQWIPAYFEDFIKTGGLVESAQGADPDMVLKDIQLWAEVAIEEIEDKKRELLDPIDQNQVALLNLVDEAFARLMSANAAITAQLNSIRKVQALQDEVASAFKLKDLRDRINDGLISASENAEKGIEKLKETEGTIDEVKEKKKTIRKKLQGK